MLREPTLQSHTYKIDNKETLIEHNAFWLLNSWLIIQTAIKSWDQQTTTTQLSKRVKALSNILDIQLDEFIIPADFATNCAKVRPHLMSILPDFAQFIINPGVADEPESLTRSREYLKTLLSGFEMASFLCIADFSNTRIKSVAHVIPIILDQMRIWRLQYNIVKEKSPNHDPRLFKLAYPSSTVIKTDLYPDLKYLAVYFKQRTEPATWGKFAKLDKLSTKLDKGFLRAKLATQLLDNPKNYLPTQN